MKQPVGIGDSSSSYRIGIDPRGHSTDVMMREAAGGRPSPSDLASAVIDACRRRPNLSVRGIEPGGTFAEATSRGNLLLAEVL